MSCILNVQRCNDVIVLHSGFILMKTRTLQDSSHYEIDGSKQMTYDEPSRQLFSKQVVTQNSNVTE